MTYFQVESLPVLYLFLFHSEFALQKENRKTIMVATVIGFWNSLTFPWKNVILISDQINWIDIFTNNHQKGKCHHKKDREKMNNFPFSQHFIFLWLLSEI